MLLGPIVDAPLEEWERMIDLNVKGLLYCAHAALPHLLTAAQDSPRQVADMVNISSVAGRVARSGSGVYNATKWGVGAFSESLRQEVTGRHVRVSLVEPGAVATELVSHNRPEIRERDGGGATTSSGWSPRTSPTRSPTSSPGRGAWRSTRCSSGRPSRSEGITGIPGGGTFH